MWLWISYLYALHKHQYHNAKDKRISGTLFYKKKKKNPELWEKHSYTMNSQNYNLKSCHKKYG